VLVCVARLLSYRYSNYNSSGLLGAQRLVIINSNVTFEMFPESIILHLIILIGRCF